MKLDTKRWLILFACMAAGICMGMAYALSVFAKPIMALLHITKQQWALAFSLGIIFLPITMLLSGKAVDKGGPRIVVIISGFLFSIGLFMAGLVHSVQGLYLAFLIFSLGGGAYGAIVATSVRWFPDRRGLASGLTVATLGVGTAIIAKIAVALIPQMGVQWTFKVFALASLAIFWLSSILVSNPPEGYVPTGFVPRVPSTADASGDLNWQEMLARLRFWHLYLIYACGAFSGIMIISQASPIAQEMAKISPEKAATIVLVLGLSNAAGRFFWGFVSDRIGRIESLIFMLLITAITMFLLPTLALHTTTFLVAAILIGVCFGGYFGTFPSLCADSFGIKHVAVNYALLFSASSLAALIGPWVGGKFGQHVPPQYDKAFIIAAIIAAVGMLLSIGAWVSSKKTQTSS